MDGNIPRHVKIEEYRVVGDCCGSTPEHVAGIVKAVK
jgi:methionine synthase I (cobalamin-dependent)